MLVPLSWLREFVPYEGSVDELAGRLGVSTCEVHRIARLGVPDEDGNLGLYRIGRVLEAGKHPNADRLQLCHVDVGEGEPRQIVCGAWNFGSGATVAVALPGAVLPDGQTLQEATLRGESSRGMILSERELELGSDHSGILVFAEQHEPGTPLTDVLPLRETVLELDTTGNRPDLLSIYGIAREVAALFRLDLEPPPGEEPPMDGDEPVDVRIEDVAGCPRYIGRLFRDVRIGPSPPFLRARLHAAGMRAISNVVDVTNYVMLELGNPLHAFDRERLAEGRIVVRRARSGEEMKTLDGVLRKLDERDLMIADAERSIAIAGIMGGEETEVTDGTTEVLLEAANFEPTGLNASSERLKLRTEGLNRWEKGVDPYLAEQAARRATGLLVRLAGARWVGHADVHEGLPEPAVLRFRPERASALTGLEVTEADQAEILGRLGFRLGSDWSVEVPTWRARDVTREIDLVEEVARYVLDDVPFTLPRRRHMVGRLTPAQRLRRLVEDVMAGCGFSEAYTWTLVPETDGDAVPLQEALSSEQAVLRTSLFPSLLEAIELNVNAGSGEVALFEIARAYFPSEERLPDERWQVAAVVRAETTEAAFFRAKGGLETLLAAVRVEPGPWLEAVVVLGEGTAGFELDLATLHESLPGVAQYEDVITFPAVKQDLAFVVPENVAAGDLVDAAREAAGPELRDMRIFDVYPGEKLGLPGRKSIAFSVSFQSPERTLSDEDAAAVRERIVRALADRFQAELRA